MCLDSRSPTPDTAPRARGLVIHFSKSTTLPKFKLRIDAKASRRGSSRGGVQG